MIMCCLCVPSLHDVNLSSATAASTCALLNLVEGGGGDWWCEADPPQGLLHAATLSRRSLLAFAQAGADGADTPLISDGQRGDAGVRGVSVRYRLQPQGTKQTHIGSLHVCRITSAVSRSVMSSHGLLSSIKVVIGDIKLDEYFLKADVCSRRVADRGPISMGSCYFFVRLAVRCLDRRKETRSA
ncbi:uncharacterized protein [Aegilops tauschii subsp. strangulata]|uniref:uncharacterized protein isoform X6 n=2 Tax=Aegilops tauschii subsp. strangulata TaxID=200361 RepID=UPI000989E6DE|nr:uncharacterized protein LOC109753528 isoform X7 [Aegilops tauschii subsp. strangulata]XP_020168024.1 uncharacterized protein LOC109753528 isoform X7 [Aegilops tauschii subsp. strangulata]